MDNIFAQMNPTASIAVAVLLLLSVAGVLILRLVRKGRAKNPGDLVKIARERAAASKETKAATKRAEAAIAEPVAPDRLSRISTKGMAEASAARPEVEVDKVAAPTDHDDLEEAAEPAGQDYGLVTEHDAGDAEGHVPAFSGPAVAEDSDAGVADDVAPNALVGGPLITDAAIDLADPDNHPTDWDGLLAVIDRLDAILAQPWHNDALAGPLAVRLAAARAAAGDNTADDLSVRALSRDLGAIDLARTINNAAREQAAEIVAAVREFAHQQSFSSADCSAVLRAMQQIEWMALIARGDTLEKRTLPLTRHDPEAPLWVADAWSDLRRTAA